MSANPMTYMSDQEHEALSQRGLALYETRLKAVMEPAYNDQYVAIHVDSEQYAVGKSSGDAMRAMRRRQSQGRLVILHISPEPEWGLASRLFTECEGKIVSGQFLEVPRS